MHHGSRLSRLGLVWLASTSLSLSGALPAFAQPGAPPGVPDAQSGGGDPPALAGRLTDLNGTVSYHPQGAEQWSPASQNFPVTSGNAYWTEPQASATIEIGDDALVMDGGTELDVTTLDQNQFVAAEPQGALFLGLRDLPQGQALTVTTPRGAVQITQPGAYEIVAGDTNDPTVVTVVSGAAHVTGNGVDLSIAAQQSATINGASTFQGSVGAMSQDQFLSAQLQKFQPQNQPPRRAPPPEVAQQVRYMTGGASLSQYGDWSQSSQYGQVWYPSGVGSDWAPYRDGHWSYVQPWGWNWVDDEPWGFAPFHYGRWINDGGRWGWVAGGGDVYGGGYPVYAPALVGFVGFGPGVLGGVGFGLGVGFGVGAGVGWFPLGFREPFVPWYRASNGYFQGINRYNVANYRSIQINNYRNVTINNYRNARFATVAPAGAFASGERLRGVARPIPATALARAQPVVGRLPVAPTARTPGLSRAEAAAYHVPLAAHPALGRGPQIRPGAFGQARPALRPNAEPVNARPAGGGFASRPGFGARPGQAGPGAGRGEPGGFNRGTPGGFDRGTEPGAARPGGAPGPAIARPGEAGARPGLPALRPARPEQAAPGVAHPGLGIAGRPGEARPGEARPGEARPGEARPGEARPGEARPGEAARGAERPGIAAPSGARENRAAGAGAPRAQGGEAGREARPERGAEKRTAAPARSSETRTAAGRPDAGRAASPEARRAAPPARPEHAAAPRAERPAAPPRPAPAARPAAPHPAPAPHAAAPRPAPEHKK